MDELIERALRGELSREEAERLAEWRRESPENERQYRRVERLLVGARGLRAELRATRVPTVASLLASARDATAGAERATRSTRSGSWWTERSPIVGAAARWAPWGVAAAAVLAAVAVGVRARARTDGPALGAAEIVTGAAEVATVELGDGSVVRIAPSSRLRIGQRRDTREVRLDGRAFFAVAKDRGGRPFLVRTRGGTARVLGTRFELATRDDDLDIVVVEGRVGLDAARNSVEVREGQASRVSGGTASAPARLARADSVLRWVGKFLVFRGTPLGAAARELERTYGIHVVIEDSALTGETVNATLTDQSASQAAGLLCSIVAARCGWTGDTVTIARAAP